LQMQALRVGGKTTLVFTKVIDELTRGLVDEDEEVDSAPADRAYWENRGSRVTVAAVDRLMEMVRSFAPFLQLKYNKHYIGIDRSGEAFNFLTFRPKRNFITMEIKLESSEEIDALIAGAGLDTLDYDAKWGSYRLRLTATDIANSSSLLGDLMKMAYERRAA